jgi:hypothetical protein
MAMMLRAGSMSTESMAMLKGTSSPGFASILESAVSAISGLASVSTCGAAASEACWVSTNGALSSLKIVLSSSGSLIAPCQSRPRMIAVGTSEMINKATNSARLLSRTGSGTKPWSLCGWMMVLPEAPLRFLGVSGAKRSAIASGGAGVSAASRSLKLFGRMTVSDWLSADGPM